ncbi:Solute carrier family 2, facilitated glucose transporter member 1 [Thelohanellus kitauei]|uniref:Solute carrier family 2, facilitated glucose transporter member 1 n=1 Tax=Thelohanellus kitauei TaxID=669202 RepID=A0A0C2J1I2_THEKT|nr:Solute carrier family 2, facilitated glucose transporter member 1 [Thelohanellus kitauei]
MYHVETSPSLKQSLYSICPYGLLMAPVIMGVMITLCSRDFFIKRHFPGALWGHDKIPDALWALACASFPLGGCFGTLIATYMISSRGRKTTHLWMIFIGLSCMAFYALSYIIKSFILFTICRFGQGISSGGLMNVGLVYLFELIPSKRHKIVSLTVQPLINLGMLISSLFSLDIITKKFWIVTSIPIVVVIILCLLITMFLPESPIFVYQKSKDAQKTKFIYKKLRYGNEELANIEFDKIANRQSLEQQRSLSVLDLLKDKSMTGPVVVSTLIAVFQQLSGINIVIFYVSEFIVAAGFDQIDLGILIIFIVCFIGSVIFTFITPHVGSKQIMISGFTGMSISFGMAYTLYHISNIPLLTIILLSLYLFWFQSGPGPKPWTIFQETFPPEYQSAAQGFLTLSNWVSNFLMTALFPFVLSKIGFHSICLFAIVNMIFAIILALLMVESKGKYYTQVIQLYKDRFPFSLRK